MHHCFHQKTQNILWSKTPYINVYYGGSYQEWASSTIKNNPHLSALTVMCYAADAESASNNTWCYGEDGYVYQWVSSSNGYEKMLDKPMSYKYEAPLL